MTTGSYSGIQNVVKLILMHCPEIDTTKTITQQQLKSLVRRIIKEKVAPLFPKFDIYAHDNYWPLEGFARLVFKSWRNKYLADAPDNDDNNDDDDDVMTCCCAIGCEFESLQDNEY
ncbi:hypothetical protein FRC10_002703 [Ceratobasidium sp. 414]|nr:hypothetical protein FRC10_002703 [Ceratobasidium sp. 414]